MKFTGNPGKFNLYINGDMVGQIPYSSTVTTTTIPNINIAGNITINITDNSAVGTEQEEELLLMTFLGLVTHHYLPTKQKK